MRLVALFALSAIGCAARPADYGRPEVAQEPPARPSEVSARLDPTLTARIVARRPLLYAEPPADPRSAPAHARAGSALVWIGSELAVIQDDALFLAFVEPAAAEPVVTAFALPPGHLGARLFDDASGNKAHKLDLESAIFLGGRLYAFGSGSTSARELVVEVSGLVRPEPAESTPIARVVRAHRLYAALRAAHEFSGSELNVEGAASVGGDVVLVQRGNGRPVGALAPVDATTRLDARAFVRYLDSDDKSAPPPLRSITRYRLGEIAGVRLTFTDIADSPHAPARMFYLAAAEASPDTVRDGAVVGTALGVIEADSSARYAPIVDEQGAVFTGKAEGIALDPDDRTRAFIVLDRDDPAMPADLCTVSLRGY